MYYFKVSDLIQFSQWVSRIAIPSAMSKISIMLTSSWVIPLIFIVKLELFFTSMAQKILISILFYTVFLHFCALAMGAAYLSSYFAHNGTKFARSFVLFRVLRLFFYRIYFKSLPELLTLG